MSPFNVAAAVSWAASHGFVEDFDNFLHSPPSGSAMPLMRMLALRPYCSVLSSCISSSRALVSSMSMRSSLAFRLSLIT